jgi:hypothetical protein
MIRPAKSIEELQINDSSFRELVEQSRIADQEVYCFAKLDPKIKIWP